MACVSACRLRTLTAKLVCARTADNLTDQQQEIVDSAAELLYGLIHARFAITPRGMGAMLEKYKAVHFGRCPRVGVCDGRWQMPQARRHCFEMRASMGLPGW